MGLGCQTSACISKHWLVAQRWSLVPLSASSVHRDSGHHARYGIRRHTGLVPALLFAGAQGVVLSLWPVDDSATEIEMKQFYSHLAGGEDAAALRDAKVDYMRLEGTRPPLF
jgi:CHAT domain-containing protein